MKRATKTSVTTLRNRRAAPYPLLGIPPTEMWWTRSSGEYWGSRIYFLSSPDTTALDCNFSFNYIPICYHTHNSTMRWYRHSDICCHIPNLYHLIPFRCLSAKYENAEKAKELWPAKLITKRFVAFATFSKQVRRFLKHREHSISLHLYNFLFSSTPQV